MYTRNIYKNTKNPILAILSAEFNVHLLLHSANNFSEKNLILNFALFDLQYE